jgi:general nucleoside transport system ATP-binding protein
MHLTLRNIHKHYGRVFANNGIDMDISEGSIHGILGENGAGKSTLMKILAGYIQRTSGELLLDGVAVDYQKPAQATRHGIGMLYQDPLDFPSLSVMDNFLIGIQHRHPVDIKDPRSNLRASAEHFGFQLNPETQVRQLTIGERQQLELLRLLTLGVEVLILDEPTTGISSIQKEILFQALRKLASEGKTILFVSHKLEDVELLCDRVTVFREGKVAGKMDKPFETRQLLEWMFGTAPDSHPGSECTPGEVILELKNVSASGGRTGLHDCNVTILSGELIGLAGLEGSGQGILLRLCSGLIKPEKGTIRLGEELMNHHDYHDFNERGVNYIPSARLEEGLIPGLTITEHFALQQEKNFIIPWEASKTFAEDKIKNFRIMGQPSSRVESLSGGNQQRLLLSLLSADPRLLLLEQPTRGLDLESSRWVWKSLIDMADRGAGVVFSSSELEEIYETANRILVFFNGHMVKDVQTRDTNLQELGRAIAGRA